MINFGFEEILSLRFISMKPMPEEESIHMFYVYKNLIKIYKAMYKAHTC